VGNKDKEILKTQLFKMLDDINADLSKYKELRDNGLAADTTFEAVNNAKKQLLTTILDMLY